jgi:predicted transcriptional regulator
MGTKRFKDQILCKILQTCEGEGASKTRIVYTSNMNFKTIKPYLVILARNELIETINESPIKYQLTPKGLKALEHFRALESLITDA